MTALGDRIRAMPDEKTCTSCLLLKHLTEFNRQPGGLYGRRARCRTCTKADGAAYRKAHPDRVAYWRATALARARLRRDET